MLSGINNAFNREKRNARDHQFILEAVLDVEEVIPGSDEELEDIVDPDSVPDDVYKKIDKALDDYISKEDYDDSDAEELLGDDDDEDEDFDIDDLTDEELEAALSEAAAEYLDEGATAEYIALSKKVCNDVKTTMKQAKKEKKAGNISQAKSLYNKALQNAKKLLRDADAIQDDPKALVTLGNVTVAAGLGSVGSMQYQYGKDQVRRRTGETKYGETRAAMKEKIMDLIDEINRELKLLNKVGH